MGQVTVKVRRGRQAAGVEPWLGTSILVLIRGSEKMPVCPQGSADVVTARSGGWDGVRMQPIHHPQNLGRRRLDPRRRAKE